MIGSMGAGYRPVIEQYVYFETRRSSNAPTKTHPRKHQIFKRSSETYDL